MKARALKEGMKHQKKCEEFLRCLREVKTESEGMQKFKELLVKSNCVKEHDDLANELINLVTNI